MGVLGDTRHHTSGSAPATFVAGDRSGAPTSLGAAQWESPNTHPGRLHHDDGSCIEVGGYLVKVGEQQVRLPRGTTLPLPTKQDHRWQARVRSGEQLPEVGISGDHGSSLSSGSLQDDPIGIREQADVSDVERVVAGDVEELGEERRQVLVEKKPHALVRSGNSRSVTASAA